MTKKSIIAGIMLYIIFSTVAVGQNTKELQRAKQIASLQTPMTSQNQLLKHDSLKISARVAGWPRAIAESSYNQDYPLTAVFTQKNIRIPHGVHKVVHPQFV